MPGSHSLQFTISSQISVVQSSCRQAKPKPQCSLQEQGAFARGRSGLLGAALPVASPLNVQERRPRRAVVMRLTGDHTFKVKGDLQKVFEYASDFKNIDEWDPGTPKSWKDSSLTRSKQAPIGVGTQFTLRTTLGGYLTPTVYEVMEYEPPRRVKFYGVSRFHDSWDTITFEQDKKDPGSIKVQYISEIALIRWFKWFEWMMSPVLLWLFDEAVKGLESKLKDMEPELKGMAGSRR